MRSISSLSAPRCVIALLFLAATSAAFAQEPYSHLRASGPRSLAIVYRCDPAQRTALRRIMLNGGVARFEEWKKQGLLADYHILFNSLLDSETYDMLTLLDFPDGSGAARWREIEKEMPGGLPESALKLVTSAVTHSLDPLRHGTAKQPAERGHSVYFVIPYDYLVPTDDYVKYFDAYVLPQVNGWMDEKVLSGFTIYLSRYSTSRAWSSLLVLEYRDAAAFSLREATVAKIREKLKSDPAWLAASANKQKVRVEKQTMIAEELMAK